MTVNTTDVIKKFEGFHSQAYWDVNQWSVGYGSYAGSRDRSQPPPINNISKAEADQLYEQQIQTYVNNVDKYDSTYNWTDNERAALTSFAYNNGGIDQLTANGTRSREEIADKMMLYSKARTGPGGSLESVDGLVSRRAAERHVFLGNDVPEGDLYEWGRENRPPGYGGVGAGNDLQGAGGQGSNQILKNGDVDTGENAEANTGDWEPPTTPFKSILSDDDVSALSTAAAQGVDSAKDELTVGYKKSLEAHLEKNKHLDSEDLATSDYAKEAESLFNSNDPVERAQGQAMKKALNEVQADLKEQDTTDTTDDARAERTNAQQPTVTDITTITEGKKSPEPNWYTSVDLPTYNWTFYLTNKEVFDDPESYLKTDLPDPNKAVIIAKSGVEATYTIDNFLFNAVLFGDDTKGSAQTSTMQFEVKEPMGFTLLDGILSKAPVFNFKTMKDATYVLKLEFKGRDPETGRPVVYDGMHFFPVVPYGVTSETGPDGTSYMFTCLTVPSLSAIENTSTAGEVHVQAVATLEELVDKLETGLNEAEILAINPIPETPPNNGYNEQDGRFEQAIASRREDTISNPTNTPRKTWEIKFNMDTANQTIRQEGYESEALGKPTSFDLPAMPVITTNSSGVARNTDDADKIDTRLTVNSNVVTWLKNFIMRQPAWNNYVKDAQLNGFTTPVIDIKQEIIGTPGKKDEVDDNTQQKYVTTVITVGIKHLYGVVRTDGTDHKKLGDRTYQQNRFEKLPIVKKYEYLHTGKNTEVLNYSAQFNMLFSISSLPRAAYNTGVNTREQIGTNITPAAFLSDIPVNTEHANVIVNLPREYHTGVVNTQETNEQPMTTMQMDAIIAESYANRTADTQVIEVDVIGDPYLLGVPGATFTGNISSTLANVTATSDIFVAFVSHFPLNKNTIENAFDKGPMDLYTSGIYELREVEHRFQQGQYVSKLRMYRDHKSSTYYLQEELKNL